MSTHESEGDDKEILDDIASDVDELSEVPLRVEGLEKNFGGITAVDGATFEVERTSLTGLIGPNGAGKSTTFNLITGFIRPDAGQVLFDDQDVTGMAPFEIANKGMVRTFQIARELGEMTVLENMMLAPQRQLGEDLWRSVMPGARNRVKDQESEHLERAWEMLEFFEIDHLWDDYAMNLSGGQRKLLEMARVLMTDPKVVLLDEPLAGVNPTLEKKLMTHIHELREQGYTFLLVEHDMDIIMEHCEHVIVMHQGKVLAEGEPADIKANDQVIDAYLGDEI
jgi:ABC-type branched-subunit amino acid transport system ATPase component